MLYCVCMQHLLLYIAARAHCTYQGCVRLPAPCSVVFAEASQPAHGKDNHEGEEDDEGDETNAMHNATDEVEVSGWFSRMSHCLL